jgi:hypothetical protein
MRGTGRAPRFRWAGVVIAAGLMAQLGCGNKQLEERLAAAESRVAALEAWARQMVPWADTAHVWMQAAHPNIAWPEEGEPPQPPSEPPPKFGN